MTTDDESGGVLLSDGWNRILLHPPRLYPDGSGYHHKVDLIGGPFRGTIDATSYVNISGLRGFRDGLVLLFQTLKGQARLSAAYENLEILLEGDGMGHISVYVQAFAGETMGTRLSFSFQMDQTELPSIIAGIERFLQSPTRT